MTLTFDPKSHIYKFNEHPVPSVTTVLKDMGFINTQYFTEEGRERGTLIHRIIEWYCKKTLDLDTVDPVLNPYLEAWIQFAKDTGFKPEAVEVPLYNKIYRVAGTPDHIGALDGRESVIDVKSGGPAPFTALQTAGYEILAGRNLKRFVLYLTGKGVYKLREFKDKNDRQVFLGAVACWHWQKNNLKGRAS